MAFNKILSQIGQEVGVQLNTKVSVSALGQPNGVATLDGTGLIPSIQLPSYVDDVIEVSDFASLPGTGESGKIYITLDNSKTYRWSGSAYLEISASEVNSVNGKTGIITLTKEDIGLGNVDDTSDLNKPVSLATQSALNLKANLSGADFTGPISVASGTTIATGDDAVSLFEVKDSSDSTIFKVTEAGNAVLAGDFSIGGSLTVAGDANVTADFTGDNLNLVGNLNVNGNTVLGDDATTDTTTINGLTVINSGVTKALGSVNNSVFSVKDSLGEALLSVKENGDVSIAGVIEVLGDGTSTFNGDVAIGGSITVAENATVTADFTSNDMTVNGNLVVAGNTTLGNEPTDTVSLVGVVTAPTPDSADNSTKVATTSFVQQVIGGLSTGVSSITTVTQTSAVGDITIGAADVGLENVDNYSTTSQVQAQAASIQNVENPVFNNTSFMTPLRAQQLVDDYLGTYDEFKAAMDAELV